MANQIPFLSLLIAKDKEPEKSWEGISTPDDLLRYFARNVYVDPNAIVKLQEIIPSSIEPTGADREKIWIKTDGAPGIGIPVGGAYRMIYTYPPNVPFLWVGPSTAPSYLRKLTDDEITKYALVAPTDTSFYYVISEVPA